MYPGEVSCSAYDVHIGQIHENRLKFLPDNRHDTLKQLHDRVVPDRDPTHERPESFNRTNMTLSPSNGSMRQDFYGLGTSYNPPVSPFPNTDVEREPSQGMVMSPAHQHNPPTLGSPSRSTRGGLDYINEADIE